MGIVVLDFHKLLNTVTCSSSFIYQISLFHFFCFQNYKQSNYLGIYFWVKYVFSFSSFSEIWNYSLIKSFDQFSPLSFKMYEFSHFNQILLSLSDVSSIFHDNI